MMFLDIISDFGGAKEIIKQGVLGAVAVFFATMFWLEHRKHIATAKSFNRQIAQLNEQRGEEIKLMAEALQANSDNNVTLSNSVERLRDFLMEYIIRNQGGGQNEEVGRD